MKERTTIYLREDVKEHIRENRVNLSEWVNNNYVKEFSDFEILKAERKQLEQDLERVNKLLEELQDKNSIANNKQHFTSKDLDMIKEMSEAVYNQGYDITPNFKRFKNETGLHSVSLAEFKTLLKDTYEEVNNDENND